MASSNRMASLTPEEENYARLSLFLSGISNRAVRTFFDQQFAPTCLYATLKKNYYELDCLRTKHSLNKMQWNLLFPEHPAVPDSKKFDINLMIILLRNLTQLIRPINGFDCLPSTTETTPCADLARFKYYRNSFAHIDDAKVNRSYFDSAWTDLSEAIGRLGGLEMKQECDQLRTKALDQTNENIMMDVNTFKEEIKELKKKMQKLQISRDDTVPWNVRERIKKTLETWKVTDKMFINTRAARQVFKCIKANSCVTIIASFGVGKTFTLRHVALQMADDEYDVILVTNPDEILKFNNPNMKTLFVVDDLCGNFSVDQSNIKSWEPVVDDIKNILDNSNIKILAACRLQIYRDVKFESLSIFKTCVCNLLSKKYCLSKSEKQAMAEVYLKTKAHEITEYLNLYDCFPLLCKMCYDVPKLNVKLFFKNPCSIYESEIHNLFMKGCYSKYCALALCVMFNNRLKEELLTNDLNEGTRTIIANTCEACRLASGTSRLLLQDELEILKGTFIKKDHNMYKVINDKIFDFLCHFYGQNLIRCVIKNAEICLIKEIFILQKDDDKDQLITIKKSKYQQMYMQRMIHDWSMGKNHDIFNHKNTTSHLFREQFVLHFKALDTSSMIKLKYIQDMAESSETNFKNDENDYDLSAILINCCLSGNISLVQWCCNLGVDVNKCDSNGQSPFMKACVKGDTEIVIFLLSRGIDFKKCDKYNQSPVMMTCKHGHSEILRILLKSGTGYNKRDINDQSLFMIACGNGHKDIVKLLLEKEADYNICNKENWSPLMMACQQGHVEIVEMLIDRGVNYTKCRRSCWSPFIIAYKKGHRNIVQILLDKESANQECVKLNDEKKKTSLARLEVMKACEKNDDVILGILEGGISCNECDTYDRSPLLASSLIKASTNCHSEMLLERDADCNTCYTFKSSLLINACKNGHTKIVETLLNKKAYYNKSDQTETSPVMIACSFGHTQILKLFLDRGIDCNKFKKLGRSLLMKACQKGHSEIVKMLLEQGIGLEKHDLYGQTPLMTACENNHTEIVHMLLDREVDCRKCDEFDRSLLIMACKLGHIELVKIILVKGTNCD